MRTLIHNIGELVTLAPLYEKGVFGPISEKDLGSIDHAWLVIEDGKVLAFGPHAEGPPPRADSSHDAQGGLVMPALIDSHSHLLFAGSRANEFYQRLAGATYQEIAKAGGGISASVRACHNSSERILSDLLQARLERMSQLGIGHIEVKTGYGLTVAEELRHLQVLQKFKKRVHPTCLALHAFPIDGTSPEKYIAQVCKELLPEVAKQSLAKWVDAFIEDGYYSVKQCEEYVSKAKNLGLGIRLHADEFSDAGAAFAAARWGARSADHLQMASDAAIEAMAKAGVIATLLPGTSLYTKIPFRSAAPFRQVGCPVAIATDANPGSCNIMNLPMLASLAALHCGLTGPETIAAVTLVPARSLELTQKGALAVGCDADYFIHPLGSKEAWLADFGATSARLLHLAK